MMLNKESVNTDVKGSWKTSGNSWFQKRENDLPEQIFSINETSLLEKHSLEQELLSIGTNSVQGFKVLLDSHTLIKSSHDAFHVT